MRLLFTIFWRANREHPRYLLLFIPASLLLATAWIAEPLYGRYAIDRMLGLAQAGEPVPFFGIMATWVGIYVFINLCQAVKHYLKWAIQHEVLSQTRERYYDHALRLDISHHVRARGGEMMKIIDNAADTTVDLSQQILLDFLPMVFTSLAFLAISAWISWQLTLVTLLVLPVYVLILWWYVRHTRESMDKVNLLWVKSLGRGYDAMTNIFTVKSVASEATEVEEMRRVHREGIVELRRLNVLWAFLEGIGYFMLIRILLIGIGVYLYIGGQLSLGSLFFFQFSFFRVIVPLEMLGHLMPRWNERIGKLKLAEDLYNTPVAVINAEHPVILRPLAGAVDFEEVGFSYSEVDAVTGLTLSVRPGEHVALVGHSGAGKSTIAMLLNRFYDVTEGAILIDRVDLRELDLHWWRRQVGLVLQENITFNDTILNNIRYARPDATDAEVREAAERASAHGFIAKLPKGYDTLVGERGIRLSGGERQRVAIARAILKRPGIVVLDEATSALDSITERDVQEGIRELIAGKTAFIIAHRLSTVRSVDRIAVLEGGRLIACAPHAELLKTCETYRRMVELQREGMLADEEESPPAEGERPRSSS